MNRRAPRMAPRLWLAVAVLLPGLLVSLATISAVDLAYGIRAGGEILDGAGIPRSDTYTLTAAGARWVDQQWLAHLLFAVIYRAGGWPLLAAFWTLVVMAISALVLYAARAAGADRRSAAIAWLLGFTVGAPALGLRAQVLGLLCLAALLAIVLDRRRHPGRMWLGVPILVAWANLHGSFPIGLALLAVAWLEDARERLPDSSVRRTAIVTLVAVAGTLVNPYGVGAWSYVAAIGADPTIARLVVEWQHTSPLAPSGAAYYASVAAVAGVVLVAARRGHRPSWPIVLWVAGLAVLGAWAARAVAWFGVGAAPIAARLLSTSCRPRAEESPREMTPGRLPRVASLTVVAALAVGLVAIQPIWRPGAAASPLAGRLVDAPAGIAVAVEQLAADRPGIRVFNAQRWGSWLELEVPGARYFADSRVEVIPASAWADYLAASGAEPGWQAILDRWGIDALAISASDQGPLVAALPSETGWQTVYRDADGIVAVRADGG